MLKHSIDEYMTDRPIGQGPVLLSSLMDITTLEFKKDSERDQISSAKIRRLMSAISLFMKIKLCCKGSDEVEVRVHLFGWTLVAASVKGQAAWEASVR